MLVDIINDAGDAAGVLGAVILLIATYRAVSIGRALMRGVYRNRAYWIGGTAITLILLAVASTVPSSNAVSGIVFLVTFVVLFAFVDTSIGVARAVDFFHRGILRWERVRKPLAVFLLASCAVTVASFLIFGAGASTGSGIGGLGVIQVFPVVGLILCWGAAALTIGARRSSDRTLRRFAKMLGLTIVCLVLFFTVWIPFAPFSVTVQDLGSTISEFFFTAGAYFLYLGVMSLSPVGHVETDDATSLKSRHSVAISSQKAGV